MLHSDDAAAHRAPRLVDGAGQGADDEPRPDGPQRFSGVMTARVTGLPPLTSTIQKFKRS